MPVTEESRHRLHQKLDRTIGEEEATTLMEHLPPTGWIDISTKQDLTSVHSDIESLRSAMDHRFEAIDHRFEEVDRQLGAIDHRLDRMDEWMRQQLWRVLTFQVAFAGLLVAAARTLG